MCRDGTLYRTASTTFSSSCPYSGAKLAQHLSECRFDYAGSDLQRNALVRLSFRFTPQAETASVIDEVHVDNTP